MSGTKMVIQRVFYKLHWFESQGSALGIPMGRLRDPAFLGHPPALVALRELAELRSHPDGSTRPLKGSLVFPVRWLHHKPADLVVCGRNARLPFQKLTRTGQRRTGSQRASAPNINMMFSQSSGKPCQMYRA